MLCCLSCLGCRGKHVLQRFHINWLLKCGAQSQSQKKLPQNVANVVENSEEPASQTRWTKQQEEKKKQKIKQQLAGQTSIELERSSGNLIAHSGLGSGERGVQLTCPRRKQQSKTSITEWEQQQNDENGNTKRATTSTGFRRVKCCQLCQLPQRGVTEWYPYKYLYIAHLYIYIQYHIEYSTPASVALFVLQLSNFVMW